MTTPEDLPPPDLLDNAGRLRRLVVALLVGGAAAAIAYHVADAAAQPEHQSGFCGSQARAFQFVFSTTSLVGGLVFVTVLKVQNWLANKKYQRERVPPAKVR